MIHSAQEKIKIQDLLKVSTLHVRVIFCGMFNTFLKIILISVQSFIPIRNILSSISCFSGTPLIRPPSGRENVVVITGWSD